MAKQRKRPKPTLSDPEGFTMTPMIDIVFQLIIFFMLITDMKRREVAPLTLPEAVHIKEDPSTEDDRVLVNIQNDGTIIVGGKKYKTLQEQRDYLLNLFQKRKADPKYQDPANPKFVTYTLMIRADGSTRYDQVQWVLMAAPKIGGVTKVQFIALKNGKK